jgi:hypothetical protein
VAFRRDHPLFKRLPLIVFAAIGIFLWQSSLFAQERKLVWQTGATRSEIRRVELQVWADDGALLKRTQLEYPHGAPPEVRIELPLAKGTYAARYVIDRAGRAQETGGRALEITSDETYWLTLGRE